jgi:mannitol-1-/sugar-/sorbitol-6-/2-deoxyglucose-6-phosphatase
MDGVLIDSEPFWKEAEIGVFNSVGVPLTPEMCETTTGMRLKDVVIMWHSKYPWDTNKRSFQDVENEIIEKLIFLIGKNAVLPAGVAEVISLFTARGLPMAIASSSNMKIINAVIDKLALRKHFNVIHSAEFEADGKPDPAIYFSTAKELNLDPGKCLAIEDSLNGLKAAISAGMKTVVIPESKNFDERGFDNADLKLHSLEELTEEKFNSLNH